MINRQNTDWRWRRYRAAYLAMVLQTNYRPGAPSDGFTGRIHLSDEDVVNPDILAAEADKVALEFFRCDEAMRYTVLDRCCPQGEWNKAFFYALYAAQLICGGGDQNTYAAELLRMAIKELGDPLPPKHRRKQFVADLLDEALADEEADPDS